MRFKIPHRHMTDFAAKDETSGLGVLGELRPKPRRPKTKRGPWSPDLVAVGPWCASQAALVPPSTPHPHTAVSHMRGAAGAPAAAPAGAERWGRCYAGHCSVPVSHSRSLIWLCRCLAVWRRARSWHAAGGAADRPGIDHGAWPLHVPALAVALGLHVA